MDTIIDFSDDYMSYMARHYPVMCLSDEFYFMPRSRAASGFLALVDSLDSEKIKDTEAYVKNLKENLDRLAYDALDIESQIDITVLEQSMSAFLTEFEAVKIWQKDPAVYLKISLLGIDHIISRFLALGNGFENSLLARLSQIPRLLNEGVRNLKNVPATYLKAAIKMADRSAAYLRNLRFSDYCAGKAFLKEAELLSKKAHESIRLFKRFLNQITPRGKYVKDRTILERILKESLFCKMSPEEIYDIAVTEYENTLREMAAVASSCPGNIPWKKILFSYSIHAGNEKQLLRLYSSQIEKIRCFLEEKDIITLPPLHKVTVSSTPEFM
ncbi:MAG: DUF885 family protein, partial [Candidatus Omnitrophica bacterium]|nr:DUF885 family protein [Candidatus Omnitrophota bacterium]